MGPPMETKSCHRYPWIENGERVKKYLFRFLWISALLLESTLFLNAGPIPPSPHLPPMQHPYVSLFPNVWLLPQTRTGGGSTIGGSLASTQVAVGSATNAISGSVNFTYDPVTKALLINGPAGSVISLANPSGQASISGATGTGGLVLQATPVNGVYSDLHSGAGHVTGIGNTAATVWQQDDATGYTSWGGSTSGRAGIGAAAIAGTPATVLLPTATGAASSLLQSDGATPQQSSWTTTPSLTTVTAAGFRTPTNCAGVGTAANPSVASCAASAAGHFSCATNASTGTCQVNTTVVTANSEIFVFESDTAVTGTALGVTCNTSTTVNPATRLLASSVAATSFTINLGTVTTNPACFSYFIIN